MRKSGIIYRLLSALKAFVPTAVAIGVVCAVLIYGIKDAGERSKEEEKRLAEESIRRAVITCYAIEGNYPPSYDYMKENYGLSIDERKYEVIYSIFASNIMPDITVLER
jgi:hypothetical protein